MPLNDMYYVGGGAGASFDAGQRRDLDQEQLRQQIQEYQLKNQQSQIMNPLLAQHQQGLNDTIQAQLPGVQGQSASQSAKGQVDTAGVGDNISEHHSKVMTQLDADQLTQMKAMGEKFSQAGAYLASIPSTTTPAGNTRILAAQQIAQQYGLHPDSPQYQSLMSTDPEKLPGVLQNLGKQMSLSSGDFLQKRAMEQDRTKALIENSNTAADSREEVARINHANDLEKYRLAAERAKKHANIEQMITQITSDPNWKANPAAVEQYSALMKSATVLRNSSANGYQNAELLNQDSPGQRADTAISDVIGPQKAAPSPEALPAGMKQVGTSKGRPVYEDSHGKRFLGK